MLVVTSASNNLNVLQCVFIACIRFDVKNVKLNKFRNDVNKFSHTTLRIKVDHKKNMYIRIFLSTCYLNLESKRHFNFSVFIRKSSRERKSLFIPKCQKLYLLICER